jgi:hypothetical protein
MTEDYSRFLETIPVLSRFEDVADLSRYIPVPDDWSLAMADVVGSTEAIRRGAYKSVNMAGAAVISAVANALGIKGLPFIFGGDGAFVAVPPGRESDAQGALSAMRTWTKDELDLDLRVSLVPVSAIRGAGHDVLVARFQASELVSYAMFAGGGAAWAERQMKLGAFAVEAARPGTKPDLTGLSCRWAPVASQHGEIVSIIVVPREGGDATAFARLVGELAALSKEEEREANPIPVTGPPLATNAWGVGLEARQATGALARLMKRAGVVVAIWLVRLLYLTNGSLGGFDARRYTRDIALNADFRKFDDGLKMTIDVTPARRARIEALLAEAEGAGICRFALLPQDSALMTCIVPTPLARDHMHFIDGGSGGYAAAATRLKAAIETG